jgi:ADP-L-glycero-D-manno-heptose 6-epimerase
MAIINKKCCESLNKESKILVTGGAGFIGSAIINELNNLGVYDIDVCDELKYSEKWLNLRNLIFKSYIELDEFKQILDNETTELNYDYVFHMGGISDFQENDSSLIMNQDLRFTFKLLNKCLKHSRFSKFIIASTDKIYDNISMPFSDDEKFINDFKPKNKLAYAKYILERDLCMSHAFENANIVSLRFSDIFGANEYHKGKQASFVYQIYDSIINNKHINYNCNEQHDFLYIKDAVKMILFFVKDEGIGKTGIYNIGSGVSASLYDIYSILKTEMKKYYIDSTCSWNIKNTQVKDYRLDIQKFLNSGYKEEMFSLHEAIKDYLKYLIKNNYLGEKEI